jgi:hypothetical protein
LLVVKNAFEGVNRGQTCVDSGDRNADEVLVSHNTRRRIEVLAASHVPKGLADGPRSFSDAKFPPSPKTKSSSSTKASLGFGCELAAWAERGSVRKDALMTLVFDMNFPSHSGRAPSDKDARQNKGLELNPAGKSNSIQSDLRYRREICGGDEIGIG